MSERTWNAVDILVQQNAVEAIEAAFDLLDPLGTEVNGLRKAKGEPLIVTGFFDEAPTSTEIQWAIASALRIADLADETVLDVRSREVAESDWLAEWKRHWRPVEVGKFVIAPPWAEVDGDKIVIRIEPNMAFGTGTHETTQLCLQAISDQFRPSQTFLDVGTGTGILAIAAAKLGGTEISACDTDLDSTKIARENAALNSVPWIQFSDGPLGREFPVFDLVCANLTLDVILPLLDLLLAKSSSTLILSGILAEQLTVMVEELNTRKISEYKTEQAGEWISVRIDRTDAPRVS